MKEKRRVSFFVPAVARSTRKRRLCIFTSPLASLSQKTNNGNSEKGNTLTRAGLENSVANPSQVFFFSQVCVRYVNGDETLRPYQCMTERELRCDIVEEGRKRAGRSPSESEFVRMILGVRGSTSTQVSPLSLTLQ